MKEDADTSRFLGSERVGDRVHSARVGIRSRKGAEQVPWAIVLWNKLTHVTSGRKRVDYHSHPKC